MAIKPFGFDAVRRKMQKNGLVEDDVILRNLVKIGEEICNHARTITPGHSSGGFDDQTGNLRSSIGFRIFKDGEPIQEGGFKAGYGKGGGQGETEARKAFDKASGIPDRGWVIFVVAGMNYATYVEAKGYNVLHLSEIELKSKIEVLKQKLGLK